VIVHNEVLTVIPAFHPVWADADPELIAVCDQEAAHGNFRAGRRSPTTSPSA
jgi:hypothetical protein